MEEKKKDTMRSPSMKVMFVVFWVYAVSILFVLFLGVSVSLMTSGEAVLGQLLPKEGLQFENFINAWNRIRPLSANVNLLGMTINSLWYAGGTALLGVIYPSITAYLLAKYKFPGRNALYAYAVVTMMLPIMGSAASSIKFYRMIGVLDTNWMIFMLASSFGENFLILYACFKGVSWSYAESAFIDGAGHFTVWLKVMLPQMKGPMTALFVTGFIARWSDTDTALLFMRTHPTIASGLYEYSVRDAYNIPVLFAGFVISAIPILLLFLCFRDKIMDIQMGGGLKG